MLWVYSSVMPAFKLPHCQEKEMQCFIALQGNDLIYKISYTKYIKYR